MIGRALRGLLRSSRPEHALLIFQSLLAALAITPFGVWRLWRGETRQGLFDLGLVVLLLAMAWIGRDVRWLRPVSRAVAVAYVAASLVVTHEFGVLGQYWFFPAIVASFFVIRSGEAFALALAGLTLQLWMAHALSGWDARTLTFLVTSLLVCVFIFAFATRLRTDNSRLYADSTLDPLTGAGNRRLLDDALGQLPREGAPARAVMLMLDIDHFKSVNDRFGHATGDLCLQRLAQRLRQRLGAAEQLYRYGGEEFIVLAPGDAARGAALAEALRADVADAALIRESPVTISVGVAERRPDESSREWIRRADDAMYAAKNAGRDRVRVAS